MSFRFHVALLLFLFVSQNIFAAAGERVLYSFPSGVNQGHPRAALVLDSAGNLYGTSSAGGTHNAGMVFMLVPTAGHYRQRILYSFTGGADGGTPLAGLTPDGAGNFFGTTAGGGLGFGTVFELSPNSDGSWTESVLHSFNFDPDGQYPEGGVIFDTAGNLFGTTSSGGSSIWGTVFELSPVVGGSWKETVLYSFANSPDGASPATSLVMDSAGNLFGTTGSGGFTSTAGCVFELSPNGAGWTETILWNFSGKNGLEPSGPLIRDSAGNLYGTTQNGGLGGVGTVFELSPGVSGWTETLLHQFVKNQGGETPVGGVTFDSSGNLYGTTDAGGAVGLGTAYKLVPGSSGYTIQYLHSFGSSTDGAIPLAGVVLDSAGNIFGTTFQGGTGNTGTVFEILP